MRVVAISVTSLTFGDYKDHDACRWLEQYQPVERIGESIMLYDVP